MESPEQTQNMEPQDNTAATQIEPDAVSDAHSAPAEMEQEQAVNEGPAEAESALSPESDSIAADLPAGNEEDREKNKAILEAMLFASGEPLAISSIIKTTGLNEASIKYIMSEMMSEYRNRNSGIIIAEIAEGYEMLTAPDTAAWIRKMKNITVSNKLSQPALETLSIIAYKQPITRIEVDQLRGVNSDAAVKSLVDKRLIKIVGKKESPGRPFLYATTKEFLQYFGLKSLGELPPINDFFNSEVA